LEDADIVLNKSKTYLLYYFAATLKITNFHLLKNTYLYYEGELKICFLYNYSGKKSFTDYERSLEQSEHYCKTVDVSKDKVLFVMDVPEELEDAIQTFLEGRYSKLPDTDGLINFLKLNYGAGEESKIIRIIRKDEKLKQEIEEELNVKIGDLDLSSPPEFSKENFTKKLYEKTTEYDDIGEDDNIQD
jgi:hypothetical protein